MLETGCSFIRMLERTTIWIVIEGARRRQRRLQQLTIPDQGISTLNFLIMLILLFFKSKAEKASALASLYKYATAKKEVYICFLKAFQTFDGKFTTAYGNMFFDPSNVRSCWQKDWFLYCTRTKFQRFLTIFFHSIESKTTAW